MNSAYFKELHRYTIDEISNLLKIDKNKIQSFINTFKLNGILKLDKVKSKREKKDYYYFKYVGVIIYKNLVIKCYPKYTKTTKVDEYLRVIMKVIRKYGNNENIIEIMNGEFQHLEYNLLSIVLFILYDFVDNGLYSNEKDMFILNGEGEIDWNRTIDNTYAFIKNGKPLYLDVYTKTSLNDELNYFRKLHMYVITQCSKILEKSGLDKLFSLPKFYFDIDEYYFNDINVVLSNIEKELNVQFITRKQVVLQTMYTFLSKRESMTLGYGISIFGTCNFNLVWEKICKFVLDDKLDYSLKNLDIDLDSSYKIEKTLRNFIDKPLWIPYIKEDNGDFIEHEADKTLIPDGINLFEHNNKKYFILFDAKYYNIIFDKNKICNYPGVGDITKQYLYELSYKNFINDNNFEVIKNLFVFPGDTDEIEFLGNIKMDILEKQNLKNITAIKLPAYKIYEMYLRGEKISIINIIKSIEKIENNG